MSLRAGAGRVDITPAAGAAMGGYGARTAPSTGTLDPLLARAAVFDDGDATIAVIVCDLLGVSRRIVEAARAAIEAATGIPAGNVMVAATHTHAGPAAAVGRAGADDPWAARAVEGITAAAVAAVGSAEAVTLKTTTVEVGTIGRNRRHPDGPYESRLKVIVAEGATGRPVVTLLHHACHATVLEADNLRFSADFPGAAARAVERAVGGVAVYLQGSCGDVNPLWIRHDAAEVDRVGGIVGTTAARAVLELRPVGVGQHVINLSWSEVLGVEPTHGDVLAGTPVSATGAVLELAWRALPDDGAIDTAMAEASTATERGSSVAEQRRARALVNRLEMERVYRRWAPDEPGATHKAEVQVLRLGPELALVGLPGEFFTETGWQIERASPVAHVLVVGYANNYLGYVPTASAFDEDGYEVGCARFEPDAASAFVAATLRLLGPLS